MNRFRFRAPRRCKALGLLAVLGSTLLMMGCVGDGGQDFPAPAAVERICHSAEPGQSCYYNVTLDFTNASHREVGRQYALAISRAMPDFERTIDALIALHVAALQFSKMPLSYAEVLSRAREMYANPTFNADYRAEIQGMQEIFSYDVDVMLDGRLSRNELLLYQFLSEVMRPVACSASAATGTASATGNTIVARNWEWMSIARYGIADVHSMTTYRNGSRSITNFGTLGTLNALTLLNQHKVFGAIINATTDAPYPSNLSERRSFFFDLRDAFETYSSLDQIANFMKDPGHSYVYNHLIFLADPQNAGVVENQVVNKPLGAKGNRSFRTPASTLNPALPGSQTWGIPAVFAAVNDFRLPDNDWDSAKTDNTTRWTSFRELYAGASSARRIDVEALKAITGYSGPLGDGQMGHGAIFSSERQELPDIKDAAPSLAEFHVAYTTMQSFVVDMNSMELWVHFLPKTEPGQRPPPRPTYRKIANPLYP